MKLKKILAIALAATTAITMVPNVAFAKTSVPASGATTTSQTNDFLDKDETITITQGNKSNNNYVDYVFKVTTPIYNQATEIASSLSASTTPTKNQMLARSNAVYKGTGNDFATRNNSTTQGEVTLSAIVVGSQSTQTIHIPGYVVGQNNGAGATGTDGQDYFKLSTGGFIDVAQSTQHNDQGKYKVTKVELDGSAIENSDKITLVNVSTSAVGTVTKLQLDNFEKLENITVNGASPAAGAQALTNVTEFSVKNTRLDLRSKILPLLANGLKKLNIADLIVDKQNGINSDAQTESNGAITSTDRVALDLTTLMPAAEVVNVHGNSNISGLTISTPKNLEVDIEDASNIEDLVITNTAANALIGNGMSPYNLPDMVGVTFVSGGEKTKNLDLSGFGSMNKVQINGAGLTGFTAPSINKDRGNRIVDVSNNALTSVNLSNASDAQTVNISNNMLMDVDVSGLTSVSSLNVSNNFLTELNIQDCEKLTADCNTEKNFIPKDNFLKDTTKQTGISLGTQREPEIAKFSFGGDMGQGLSADTKGTVKLGGTATLNFGVLVAGAPDGFAARLAETIDFKDGNDNEASAVTLGEKQILIAREQGFNSITYGGGNQSVILASVPVTGNAEKKAADKITATAGNFTKTINVNTDNVALISYDIESAIPAETYKKANENPLLLAQFYYPTTAYVLGSNGTVNATIQSEKPDPDNDRTLAGAYTMKGLTFTKWNTAADGSGTAISAGGRFTGLAEDSTLYAQYTENTYTVKFDKSQYVGAGVETINGSTTTQNKVTYGEEIALNSSGYSTKKGSFYGWKNGSTFYSDGQTVQGLKADKKKSDDITMYAIFGDVDHYTTTKESSLSLVVGDPFKGYVDVDDLDAVVTGAPNDNDQLSVDLGYDDGTANYYYMSSDNGVVEFEPVMTVNNAAVYTATNKFVAKGAGTANIYVFDKKYDNVATIAVTVTSKEQAASDAAAKEQAAKVNKAIAAGDKTDVTAYSKTVSEVKLNADGTDTITVTKGNKTAKTVNLATKVVVGDKEYTITQVAANAYKGAKLTTLKTGNNVKTIGASAFANAKKLKKAVLGKKVAKIGAKAFYNTVKLTTVSVATKKLTKTSKVGANAFKNAGKKVNTKVNFTKAVTKKAAKAERKVLKKRGLKTYGKKKATYTWKSKKF